MKFAKVQERDFVTFVYLEGESRGVMEVGYRRKALVSNLLPELGLFVMNEEIRRELHLWSAEIIPARVRSSVGGRLIRQLWQNESSPCTGRANHTLYYLLSSSAK